MEEVEDGRLKRMMDAVVDALLPRGCPACGVPVIQRAIFCRPCEGTLRLGQGPGLFAFGAAIREAITRAKFGPDESAARGLARLMRATIPRENAIELDAVAFVPAPAARVVERGFDLPALLAASAAAALERPVLDALRTNRRDPPLSAGASLAARAEAVRGRFRCVVPVADKRILLVDDVRTTGATLGEARRILEEAGADVAELALAQAP
jgi:predicted amidophosphoribosyltransferase